MRFIPTTERDYLRTTKQTPSNRGKRTTSGAKFLTAEKYRRREVMKKATLTYQYVEGGELVTGSFTLPQGDDISAHFQG